MTQKKQLQLLSVLVVVSALITFWGHMEANGQHKIFDALYLTLQTAKLSAALEDTTANWQLQIMRFVLPALTIFTLIVAILLSARQWAQFKVLRFAPPEVVFLGAGRAASSLAKAFLSEGTRAVALDPDIDQDHARAIKKEGATLLPGTAADVDTLKKLQVCNAKRIYVATDEDMRNMDTALTVMEMTPRAQGKKLVIRMADKAIQEAFMQHQTVKDYAAKNDVIWLDLSANAARFVLQKYPPLHSCGQERTRHIGIFGFDALGKELLLQAVRTVIVPNGTPIHVTVFSHDAHEMEHFLQCYPALDPNMQGENLYCGLAPVAQVDHVAMASKVVSPVVLQKANEKSPFSAFYISARTDHEALAITKKVAQFKIILSNNAPVVCCLPGTSFETSYEVEKGRGGAFGKDVKFFHVTADQFHPWESFPGETLDACGMIINEAYRFVKKYEKPVPIDERWPKLKSKSKREKNWLELDERFRGSSRYSGDHFWEKLRWLGFELSEGSAMADASSGYREAEMAELLEALGPSQVKPLMRIEHQRFLVERLLDGWVYGAERNDDRQINKTLIPYDDLPEDEKRKDESIIRSIPAIAQELITLSQERAGPRLRLYRRGSPSQSSTD